MRHNILIILTIIATACLYVLASGVYAIDETEGLTADQIIDQSNGVYTPVVDSRFPATPQAARQLASSMSGTSTTQHLSSGESASPQASRSSSTDQTKEATASSSASTETPAASAPAATSTDLSGKWSIKLSDAQAEMTLYQNQGAVIGVGTARVGNDTRHVTASGSLSGDKSSLDLVFFESVELYKLSLTLNGDMLSGDYVAYPSSGSTWTGNADGTRSSSA